MNILLFMARKRKAVSYRIDELVIEALGKMAKQENASVNRYIELHFFKIAKEKGLIGHDIELLGETRGGDTTKNN